MNNTAGAETKTRLSTPRTRVASSSPFATTRRGRRLSIAGAAYVGSWIAGLIVAPATPAATATASEVHTYYANDGAAILFQSSLIHGIAGIALVIMALTVPSATGTTGRLAAIIRGFGIGAATVSFVQVAIAVAGVLSASNVASSTSDALFDALNYADTVKLVLLAVFAGSVTVAGSRAGMLRRWMRPLTITLVVALPVGGMAFVISNALLTGVLYVSLPLLLLWAGATTYQIGRRAR